MAFKKQKNCKPCMTLGYTNVLHKPCKGDGCKGCKFKGSTQVKCKHCDNGVSKK